MIYLDNGATTYPKPERVRRAVADAFVRFGANPGRGRSRHGQPYLRYTRPAPAMKRQVS